VPTDSRWPSALLAAALFLAACREGAPPPAPMAAAPAPATAPVKPAPAGTAAAAVHRYTVRGEIVQLPRKPGDELMVRHEAIPDFKDRAGAAVGMDAMVMGFGPGPGLSLSGLAPGDKVALSFAIAWEQPALTAERIEKLPPATELRFGKAAAR